ncbi:hypothetical protein A8990_11628 [Paenibacillus taihuensis]|uniref:Uncharacterized protein n=2 Tax=Paenibacillus taihuensis TaxID=1156355 RepID=A0A3D9RV31_9BACL|nr:hypothetical protein [Paenibacillus taihuensis]REE83849.1 hypothetical protein A8990_11628 [Paenibacillus taihuensis]
MGVKHAREYSDILSDLTEALVSIEDGYLFFEMETEDWEQLEQPQRLELMEALADDVFYALGEDPVLHVGGGIVTYRPKHHIIEVSVDQKESRIIRLI